MLTGCLKFRLPVRSRGGLVLVSVIARASSDAASLETTSIGVTATGLVGRSNSCCSCFQPSPQAVNAASTEAINSFGYWVEIRV